MNGTCYARRPDKLYVAVRTWHTPISLYNINITPGLHPLHILTGHVGVRSSQCCLQLQSLCFHYSAGASTIKNSIIHIGHYQASQKLQRRIDSFIFSGILYIFIIDNYLKKSSFYLKYVRFCIIVNSQNGSIHVRLGLGKNYLINIILKYTLCNINFETTRL